MDITTLFNAMPGAVSQGLIWAIMGIGVYITFRILDVADLTLTHARAWRRGLHHVRYGRGTGLACHGHCVCGRLLAGSLRVCSIPLWASRRFWPAF